MPNRCITKKQIALLHVAKAQLGLSDETYRAMLGSVGVLSSVQLTGPKFDELMRRMEAGGFRVVGKTARRPAGRGLSSQDLQLRKIKALLTAMNLPDSYADGIARQMWGVDRVGWCRPDQLRGVIAALVRRQKKSGEAVKRSDGEAAGKTELGDAHAV